MSRKCSGSRGFSTEPSPSDKGMRKSGQIASDGHVCQGGGDAENREQGCLYIPPGDNRREAYRLATFRRAPKADTFKFWVCACGGFYYTGEGTKTKCFSCYKMVENWDVGDDPTAHEWHKDDCAMANGTDKENQPLETPRKQLKKIRDHVENLNSGVERPLLENQSPTNPRSERAGSVTGEAWADKEGKKVTVQDPEGAVASENLAVATGRGNTVTEPSMRDDRRRDRTTGETADPAREEKRVRSRKRSGSSPKGGPRAGKMNPQGGN